MLIYLVGNYLNRYKTSAMKNLLSTIHRDAFLRKTGLFRLSIVTITTICLCSISDAIEMKGMNYIAWDANGLFTEDSDTSLANTQKIGCNWIGLNVTWYQDDVNSTLIEPDPCSSSTTESVIHAIDKCHELGMKVMLKPIIDCRDGAWRGLINPSDGWFASYQDFINFWADVAENHNVELFCAGCEYANTTGELWSPAWKNVIQNIRTHYTGPLIYAANKDEEKNIDWWDKLDYIGIDAYYSLTDQNNPTLEELETAWGNRADAIEFWRNGNWPNMQIIFTEVGYRSIDGVNKAPWLRPSSIQIDLQEQADCYNALLNQCKDRQWWSGVFWWNWEVDPNFGGPNNAYYTPHNKPAEAVLADYYVCLKGDLTRDCKVNFEDLSMIAAYWLSYNPSIDIYPAPYGDGIIDYHDFATVTKNWMVYLNLNGDINGDCKIDFEDLRRLANQWLRVCKPGSISEDINRDGLVNFADYALFVESWMQAPPP
jgi:hypothetical protein